MRIIHREIAGAFIFSNDSYILLGQSKPGGVYPGYMMIPGGGVDEGETKQEAVTRETFEEVGLDVQDAEVELVNDTQYGESEKTLRDGERVLVKMHFNDFAIRIAKPAKEIIPRPGDDFGSAEWIAFSDLPHQKLTASTKITLRKLGYLD